MDAAARSEAAAASVRATAAARFPSSRRFGAGDAAAATLASISLELKILGVLVMLLLFLLFLIALLWDRYGREIGELYTPSAARVGGIGGGVGGAGGGVNGSGGADAGGGALALYVCFVARCVHMTYS